VAGVNSIWLEEKVVVYNWQGCQLLLLLFLWKITWHNEEQKSFEKIAERRKVKELTQKQLADRMGVSDKAVSKWETGRSMPDNAILFELCEVLEINVNELLSGEKLSSDSYHGKAEENMMKLMKEKQKSGRISAVVGLVLGILFLLLATQMVAGNIMCFFDLPSLILIFFMTWIILFMSGLTKDFLRGFILFFGKRKEMDSEMLCRTKVAYKLVLIALPSVGMVMSLIALVAVFGILDDIQNLGPNLAVAILTLFYSLVLEMLLLPVAGKLWTLKGQDI